MSEQLQQGSDAWLKIRCGRLTASRMDDATAKTKTGYGASRKNYLAELLVERLTGQPAPSYVNAAMQHGIDNEQAAADAYEFERNADLTTVGFVEHPRVPMSGASPDRLVGDEGLIEIKAPNTATHLDALLTGKIDGKYIKQMQWQMACTGRKWCDFVSYDPRVPLEMQLFIGRVDRDEKMIAELEAEATQFLKELAAMEEALRAKFGLKAAA